MRNDLPMEGMALTHTLVVSEMVRARDFYHEVLGAKIIRESGGTFCVLQFQGAWLLLITGGGSTDDKLDVTVAPGFFAMKME